MGHRRVFPKKIYLESEFKQKFLKVRRVWWAKYNNKGNPIRISEKNKSLKLDLTTMALLPCI